MAKAYYSTVFEQKAQKVWEIVRDFNNYPVWVGGAGESEIEDGKSGDTIGAVRSVLYQQRRIRQRLLAQSDVVSLHPRVTDETRGMIGAAQFAAMKPGSFFIALRITSTCSALMAPWAWAAAVAGSMGCRGAPVRQRRGPSRAASHRRRPASAVLRRHRVASTFL